MLVMVITKIQVSILIWQCGPSHKLLHGVGIE